MLLSFPNEGVSTSDECSLDVFVGTWEGKVEFEGDELKQGPFVFSIGDDQTSLFLTDETEKKYKLEVSGCIATHYLVDEDIKSTTNYIFKDGKLIIEALIEFPDREGKMLKVQMSGGMSKL